MKTYQVSIMSISLTINLVVFLALGFVASNNFDYQFSKLERREAASKEVVLSRVSDDDYITQLLNQK